MNHSGHKTHKQTVKIPVGHHGSHAGHAVGARKSSKAVYAKVFRWSQPQDLAKHPAKVEVIGSFTHWQPVPLVRGADHVSWQVTIDDIEGNKTHHYMLLVDGHPANDKNSDGYAIPHGEQEKQYALQTPRGPRLFMLFAQAK